MGGTRGGSERLCPGPAAPRALLGPSAPDVPELSTGKYWQRPLRAFELPWTVIKVHFSFFSSFNRCAISNVSQPDCARPHQGLHTRVVSETTKPISERVSPFRFLMGARPAVLSPLLSHLPHPAFGPGSQSKPRASVSSPRRWLTGTRGSGHPPLPGGARVCGVPSGSLLLALGTE